MQSKGESYTLAMQYDVVDKDRVFYFSPDFITSVRHQMAYIENQ